MHRLPPDTDLSFLVGATLTQVCIGENEFILNFDTGPAIMVASSVRISARHAEAVELDSAVAAGGKLTAELGGRVESAVGTVDGTTTLTWSSGTVVSLLDNWADYESYTIRHGSTIVVV